jgi:hypothetical protein
MYKDNGLHKTTHINNIREYIYRVKRKWEIKVRKGTKF